MPESGKRKVRTPQRAPPYTRELNATHKRRADAALLALQDKTEHCEG